MNVRKGQWLQTYTGRQFWPYDPRPEDFDIEDIAHALANTCRFNGHTNEFYSVAQHSVHVSKLCSVNFALEGLMHDAVEAYIGDMIRPLKHDGSQLSVAFLEVETHLEGALAQRYALLRFRGGWPVNVNMADNVALATEKRDVMELEAAPWGLLPPPDPEPIVPLAPRDAKRLFLDRFEELYGSKATGSGDAR